MNAMIPDMNHALSSAPARRVRRLPVGLAMALSVTAGLISAAVLVAIVFPGAPENIITGSILLGFGIGWAVLILLSAKLTDQPQRWATFPAIAMSATGLSLMVFAPQNAAFSILNWIWPPAMLALVVWIWIKIPHNLKGKGRWLLLPVLAALSIASVGAVVTNVGAAVSPRGEPIPGKSFTVSDHRLHLDCRGTGSPTLVLFNGLGEVSTSWTRIVDQASPTTRVCAYDRAGQGWSEDTKSPQDGVAASADLHGLLAAAGEHGPFVLVGHSIGGTYAMTYAERFPEQVAGMVLLDSSSPRQFEVIPSYPAQYALMLRALAVGPTLTRLGLGPLFGSGSHLPGKAASQTPTLTGSSHGARNTRDELSILPMTFHEAQALTTLHSKPLGVLTASESLQTDGWTAAQNTLAHLSSNSVHRNVTSSHAGLLEDVPGAAASAQMILQITAQVREAAVKTAR
jgi:pimeloyl-ACP methyl ester carboxylesterase